MTPSRREHRIGGIVPAAGRSERMGVDKALLSPGGKSFLERVYRCFDRAGCHPIAVVVADLEGPVAAEARRLGAQVHLNADPSDGPISSLRVGLAALPEETSAAAWCPVDIPLLDCTTVALLVGRFRERPGAVVVPRHQGRTGHPVIIPRSLFAALREPGLAEGARTVFRRADTRVSPVDVSDPGVLLDIDTPADFEAAFPGEPLA